MVGGHSDADCLSALGRRSNQGLCRTSERRFGTECSREGPLSLAIRLANHFPQCRLVEVEMDAVQRHMAVPIQLLANVLDTHVVDLDRVVGACGVQSCPNIRFTPESGTAGENREALGAGTPPQQQHATASYW